MNEPPTDVHKPLNSLKGKVVRMEAIQMGLGDEDFFAYVGIGNLLSKIVACLNFLMGCCFLAH